MSPIDELKDIIKGTENMRDYMVAEIVALGLVMQNKPKIIISKEIEDKRLLNLKLLAQSFEVTKNFLSNKIDLLNRELKQLQNNLENDKK